MGCVTLTGHASSRWHHFHLSHCSLLLGTHIPWKQDPSSFLCCCLSTLCGRSFRPSGYTQVQTNIVEEISLSLGRHRAKRICSIPLQISGRLVLMAIQPETCSSLNPTFRDPRGLLSSLMHSLQGWTRNQLSQLTGAQPDSKVSNFAPWP